MPYRDDYFDPNTFPGQVAVVAADQPSTQADESDQQIEDSQEPEQE